MPDITMCNNHKCEKKYSCYRYLAELNEFRQAYASFQSEDCSHYWNVKKLYCKECKSEQSFRIKMGGVVCDKCDIIIRKW